ncbi:MAG: TonB family protein [Bacteroidales bacterium]|nr:TonB family protein [Bacteroidales bacterium]
MRLRLFAAALVSVLSLAASSAVSAQFLPDDPYSSLYDTETVTRMKKHVDYICSGQWLGRAPGSEGEKAVAEYVADVLKEYGVDLLTPRSGNEFTISREGNDPYVSRNVYGFIQGYDSKLRNEYIVIGARMDNLGTVTTRINGEDVERIYHGANGNASGLAMLLELAGRLSTNSVLLRRSVLLVGFGASSDMFSGSFCFLNKDFKDADRIKYMVNLDMLGLVSRGFYAYTVSNPDMNAFISSVSGELQPITPQLTAAEPYPTDQRSFYAKDIPSVLFTTGKYAEHDTDRDLATLLEWDGMERELEYIYNASVALCNTDREISFHEEVMKSRRGTLASDVVSYFDCDVRPMFQNSPEVSQFLKLWVYPYLKYPQKAVEQGIQGIVHVNFVVDETGQVKDVSVVRSVDPLLDAEAVRIVSASPKWRPGRVRDKKVKTSLTIQVEFRLEKKGQSKGGMKLKKY